ncbi:hypothetical protein H2Y54_21325 [Pectobacterium aroidearum]|uniref:hypothetical protein n=1 Tax=Pectobacterium aroidearum TaxID=1201031 RepID=UPI0015EFF1B1|nr:hypothetical protein [Pectobacterium aroidearum]MBA5239059.1 hypothetical protein [Pectobacterium aroidearum]
MGTQLHAYMDKIWFHGTDSPFSDWSFPPPIKMGSERLVPHSAIFLTSDELYARGAGKHLCQTRFIRPPKLIDTVNDTHTTELLRQEVMKNSIMARSLNTDKVFWHAGWVTGDVLRFTYSDAALEKHIQKVILVQAREFSISIETSAYIAGLNLTRGLIEEIVKAARTMGFDGFTGFEVDRHCDKKRKEAREILALHTPGFITKPDWVQ